MCLLLGIGFNIPATADQSPELQVYRSLDHMYSCKIKFFVGSVQLYVFQINAFDFDFDFDKKNYFIIITKRLIFTVIKI